MSYQKNTDFKKKRKPLNEKYSSYEYALFLLSKRDYSVYRISQKLKEKEYSISQINEAVSKLKEQSYLNDDRFTEMFIRSKSEYQNWGAYKIKMELKIKHGITEDLVHKFIDNIDFDDKKIIAYVKKFGITEPIDSKDYQRRQRFLASRGFSPKIPKMDELEAYH